MELAWFRKPGADDEGTLNLAYNILDLPVIRGRATDPAVTGAVDLDFAGLLEQVGAVAGAFRSLGVTPGSQVGVRLDDPVRELVALLATLRLGATFVEIDASADLGDTTPGLLVTDTAMPFGDHVPPVVVVSGIEPGDPTRDVAWEVAHKAGATDPAGCEPVAPGTTAYVLGASVRTIDVAADPSRLGVVLATLLAGGPVHLDTRGEAS
ncbi:propionyl-CoA synthetase [Nocardioides sp. JQ2195]|uniref:propionyl-CoA synthetase n=1 Tax=Nocardioides sp. JQ2195 TaxID=2592334 RepID=UPI00143E27A9|nr:propionyl-CoA synthetase [Nocardioides sp. JQ2195]QIX26247.1 propionyl-CoA synthetase [Nocardioides sp. JQ2195]